MKLLQEFPESKAWVSFSCKVMASSNHTCSIPETVNSVLCQFVRVLVKVFFSYSRMNLTVVTVTCLRMLSGYVVHRPLRL